MRRFFILIFAIIFVSGIVYSQKAKKKQQIDEAKLILKTRIDSICYGYGMTFAQSFENLEKFGFKINMDIFNQGLIDFLVEKKTILSPEQSQNHLDRFAGELEVKQAELRESQRKETAEKNLKEEIKFLLENKGKAGVKTTASGLQYKIIKEGEGEKPKLEDTVMLHFSARTLDGMEFGSTYKANQPAYLVVNQVINGWKEGLLLMQEGAEWEIYIPSKLGYGENGFNVVPPNATLIFDIKILKIIKVK